MHMHARSLRRYRTIRRAKAYTPTRPHTGEHRPRDLYIPTQLSRMGCNYAEAKRPSISLPISLDVDVRMTTGRPVERDARSLSLGRLDKYLYTCCLWVPIAYTTAYARLTRRTSCIDLPISLALLLRVDEIYI